MPPSSQTIQHIKDTYTREEFPARSLLVKEGALAKKMFYIDQGCCRIWFNNGDKEVTYQFLFEGTFASHMMGAVNNEPSWFNIETQEPTITYSIVRRVPQHHIASFLGITSVSLSRIRNRK